MNNLNEVCGESVFMLNIMCNNDISWNQHKYCQRSCFVTVNGYPSNFYCDATENPRTIPSYAPSWTPSSYSSHFPSTILSHKPTIDYLWEPSKQPSFDPSQTPSNIPTVFPSAVSIWGAFCESKQYSFILIIVDSIK